MRRICRRIFLGFHQLFEKIEHETNLTFFFEDCTHWRRFLFFIFFCIFPLVLIHNRCIKSGLR